jgi:glycosyltransferase involved in cell wall biosynthesis
MVTPADPLENNAEVHKDPLHLLSVVIPAHNEEGCIASTVEHLHLELRLQNVPHEIVVVDDGSTDATWQKLLSLCEHISTLRAGPEPGSAWIRVRGGKRICFNDWRRRLGDDGG